MLAEICLHNKLHIASFYKLKGNTDNFGDYPMLFFFVRDLTQNNSLLKSLMLWTLKSLSKDDSKNICLKKSNFLGICSFRYDHS